MPTYNVVAEVLVLKSYYVTDAEDAEHALEIVRSDYEMMDGEIISSEIQELTISD